MSTAQLFPNRLRDAFDDERVSRRVRGQAMFCRRNNHRIRSHSGGHNSAFVADDLHARGVLLNRRNLRLDDQRPATARISPTSSLRSSSPGLSAPSLLWSKTIPQDAQALYLELDHVSGSKFSVDFVARAAAHGARA